MNEELDLAIYKLVRVLVDARWPARSISLLADEIHEIHNRPCQRDEPTPGGRLRLVGELTPEPVGQ